MRPELDAMLDACVEHYEALDEDEQVKWELFDKLDKDPRFRSAFGEHMYRLWAARVNHLGS